MRSVIMLIDKYIIWRKISLPLKMQIFISHFDLKTQPVDFFFKTRKMKAGQEINMCPVHYIKYVFCNRYSNFLILSMILIFLWVDRPGSF